MDGIVVGVDESSAAQDALRWAQSYGRLRQQPVTALMAWDYIGQVHADDDASFDAGYSPEVAAQELDKMIERALGPDSGIVGKAVLDKAERALHEASTTADLLVVGARGLGGFRGLLLGSVSRHVLQQSKCPVAVVRDVHVDRAGPIVVGCNGSEHSERALRWAVGFAADAGRPLVAVWAYQVPILGGAFSLVAGDSQGAAEAAAEALGAAVRGARIDGIEIAERVVGGQPASQLLAVAHDEEASLLVVGARGSSGVSGALLGSVTDQVVHHATTPVVIVP